MALKFTKAQEKKADELIEAARQAIEAMVDYLRDDVVVPIRDEVADKSEKWAESETGQSVIGWLDQWDEFFERQDPLEEIPGFAPDA